ncbi:hypothetical protein LU674_011775 [Pseudomonas alloputida]|uniref:Uncharacterized protein n=1 Tax=Pseudomonas alloputida TaxID=1940621 RepID=A0AAW7HK88_9PSED|nr:MULTISPECIES: hypothetical protein [Pseudomonas]MBP2843864.1 hypothetical protein [Pseudomonas sp. PNP]MCE0864074.1 hypothetical protein [Pseudomonas alloputida]MCE0869951.1 hypothetical protein [Pseudomonas alloputida]MCE0893051.1 hypothetical protein [Pseudomonas alloputida]MCE0922242.1 hypothetical protein [Pseudomonas alloputida]
MPYLFSPSELAFYHTGIPYPTLPEDVREIADEEHEAIMEGLLRHGKVLRASHQGAPMAVERDVVGSDQIAVPNTAQHEHG